MPNLVQTIYVGEGGFWANEWNVTKVVFINIYFITADFCTQWLKWHRIVQGCALLTFIQIAPHSGCKITQKQFWGFQETFSRQLRQLLKLPYYSKLLYRSQWNFTQWWRPSNIFCGWSKYAPNKSKMADGAILKKCNISKTDKIFWQNVAQWCYLSSQDPIGQ